MSPHGVDPLASALHTIEPLKNTPYYEPAASQIKNAFVDGGVRRARAKARIIRDTWDTGVGYKP